MNQIQQRALIVLVVIIFFLGAWIWYRSGSPSEEITAPASADVETAPDEDESPSEMDAALAEQEMLEGANDGGSEANDNLQNPTYEEKKLAATAEKSPDKSTSSPVTLPPPVEQNPFKNAPKRETYRDQAAKDPHGTPAVLTAFASEMADAMKDAKAHPDNAQKTFTQLIQCASMPPDKEILTVRAICGENAATLAKQYPDSMLEIYKEAYSQFPADLRSMLRWNPL